MGTTQSAGGPDDAGVSRQGAPGAPASAAAVFGARLDLACRYADLLATTGISHGLIGPRERPRLWERHLVNCAVLADLIPQGERVIDIGSGAGLPGIVLAIARPDLRMDLVEPLLRRTRWLEQAVRELRLDTVRVHRGRADEFDEILSAPVVTARAVAPLEKLIDWSMPLLEPRGHLLALKGASAGVELQRAAKKLRSLKVSSSQLRELSQPGSPEPVRVIEVCAPTHP